MQWYRAAAINNTLVLIMAGFSLKTDLGQMEW